MALEISYARCAIITSILKKSAARLTFFVFYFLPNVGFFLLSLAKRKKQRDIHLTRALPYMEGA